MYKIALFSGDGIGVEVTEQAAKLIRKIGKTFHLVFEIEEGIAGGASIDKFGEPLTAQALELWAMNDGPESVQDFRPSLFDETRPTQLSGEA